MTERALFRRRHRLTKDLEFQAVFRAKVRKSSGPMTVYALPNELPHDRLGLSIGRKVGNAVRRGRLKRLVREAFRLSPNTDRGFDYVVVLRPHGTLDLADYERMLADCGRAARATWQRRSEKGSRDDG